MWQFSNVEQVSSWYLADIWMMVTGPTRQLHTVAANVHLMFHARHLRIHNLTSVFKLAYPFAQAYHSLVLIAERNTARTCLGHASCECKPSYCTLR